MKFFTSTFAAVALLASVAVAAIVENPFSYPEEGSKLNGKAGNPGVVVKWKVTKGEELDLILRKGKRNSLDTIGLIERVKNTGSYTWYIDPKLPSGNDYALELRFGTGPDDTNYTGQFTLETDTDAKASSSSGTITSTAKTSSATGTATRSSTLVTSTASSNVTRTVSSPSSTGNGTSQVPEATDNSAPGRTFGATAGAAGAMVLAIAALL